MSYELVWFKRDLRWQDHAALAHASKLGPVRCIYVVEPELWLQPDTALQHFEFVRESLHDLDAHLRTLGGCVEIHTGEVPDVRPHYQSCRFQIAHFGFWQVIARNRFEPRHIAALGQTQRHQQVFHRVIFARTCRSWRFPRRAGFNHLQPSARLLGRFGCPSALIQR